MTDRQGLPEKPGKYLVKVNRILPQIKVDVIQESVNEKSLIARIGKLNLRMESIFTDENWQNASKHIT